MRRWMWIAAALAGGVGIFVVALAVGRGTVEPPQLGRSPSPRALPRGFVLFQDTRADIEIAYPEAWRRFEPADPNVVLIATPNERDFLLVRVIPLPAEIDPRDVAGSKPVLDKLLQGSNIKVLDARQVTLGGIPGWFYLYTFTDKETNQVGVHTHYFLFNGSDLDILVFQALPKDRFDDLAPTFDQIANTFRATG